MTSLKTCDLTGFPHHKPFSTADHVTCRVMNEVTSNAEVNDNRAFAQRF